MMIVHFPATCIAPLVHAVYRIGLGGGDVDFNADFTAVSSLKVYACGISTGEVLIFDVRAAGQDRVVHEMRVRIKKAHRSHRG